MDDNARGMQVQKLEGDGLWKPLWATMLTEIILSATDCIRRVNLKCIMQYTIYDIY